MEPPLLTSLVGSYPQPDWLIEGLAVYHETDRARGIGRGQSSYFDMLMRMEVARGVPTAIVAASADADAAQTVQALFHSPAFRVYPSSDVHGVASGQGPRHAMARRRRANERFRHMRQGSLHASLRFQRWQTAPPPRQAACCRIKSAYEDL